MKIIKCHRHFGVDRILKAALGETLEVIQETGMFQNMGSELSRYYLKSVQNPSEHEYDIAIIDDFPAWEYLNKLPIVVKKWVWYCHGTYEKWPEMASNLKNTFSKFDIIFPNNYKKEKVISWFGDPYNYIVLPIAPPDFFFFNGKPKNSKCIIVDNHFLPKANIYDGFDNVKYVLNKLYDYGDSFHIYGINDPSNIHDGVNGYYLKSRFIKGFVFPVGVLNDYSVAIFPSGCPSIGFNMMELMSAGVAIVTTPKEGLVESENGRSYCICKDPKDMMYWVKKIMMSKTLAFKIGSEGKRYVINNFNFTDYSNNLKDWLGVK